MLTLSGSIASQLSLLYVRNLPCFELVSGIWYLFRLLDSGMLKSMGGASYSFSKLKGGGGGQDKTYS